MSNFVDQDSIPTWEQLCRGSGIAGESVIYSSAKDVVTTKGVWLLRCVGSITLTIAIWEKYGKSTRVNRYNSLSKLKITNTNADLIPVIFKMVELGNTPANIAAVRSFAKEVSCEK